MPAKKKTKVAHKKKSAVRTAAKPEVFHVERIWYGIGFAALALLVSSQFTYTQGYRSNVLGDEDKAREEQKHQEEQNQEEQKHQEEQSGESAKNSGTDTQQPNGQRAETESEYKNGIKIKTKVEDGGETKVEIEKRKAHFSFEAEDGNVRLKVENSDGEEIQTRERLREKAELEQTLDDERIDVSSDDGHLAIEHNAVRARVNFPLSIDPVTHELIVTTPEGEKTVSVLPDAAVQRLLASGFLTRVASDSAVPTASGSAVLSAAMELKLHNGNLVYEVQGQKEHKLFGFIPVATARTVTVSALTGEMLSQTQSWLSSFLGLLSF